jgi:hypothetical protein
VVDSDDGAAAESRPPVLADLLGLCRELNREGAKYIVVGGMAVIQAGFVRATEDIDLLIETSAENVERVRRALMTLPDGAIGEMGPDDVNRYVVVRIADEIVVDLMKAACGLGYDEALWGIETVTIEGVPIPFAGPPLLLRLKQTVREKDRLDRMFLEELLSRKKT